MAAKLLDGKAASEALLEEVRKEVSALQSIPSLAIVSIGDDAASKVYMKNKLAACEKVGMRGELIALDGGISQSEAVRILQDLNARSDISGIIVQVPVPKHLDVFAMQSIIHPLKDADGFCIDNLGRLMAGRPQISPATPAGIMRLLAHYRIPLAGKRAVVVGRSNTVGKPMAQLLLQADATVTIAHSKTKNLAAITKQADIIVVAVGKPNTITSKMVKNGAVVIDVGMNRVNGKSAGDAGSGGRLAGDADFAGVSKIAGWISPVPGGVGKMTVAQLIANTLRCHKLQRM